MLFPATSSFSTQITSESESLEQGLLTRNQLLPTLQSQEAFDPPSFSPVWVDDINVETSIIPTLSLATCPSSAKTPRLHSEACCTSNFASSHDPTNESSQRPRLTCPQTSSSTPTCPFGLGGQGEFPLGSGETPIKQAETSFIVTHPPLSPMHLPTMGRLTN